MMCSSWFCICFNDNKDSHKINLIMTSDESEQGKLIIKRDGQGNPKIPFIGKVVFKSKAQSTNRFLFVVVFLDVVFNAECSLIQI